MLLITDEELDLVCEEVIEEHEGIDWSDLQEIEKNTVKHMRNSEEVRLGELVRSGWTKTEIKRYER